MLISNIKVLSRIDGCHLFVGKVKKLLRHTLRHQGVRMVLSDQLSVDTFDLFVRGTMVDAKDFVRIVLAIGSEMNMLEPLKGSYHCLSFLKPAYDKIIDDKALQQPFQA